MAKPIDFWEDSLDAGKCPKCEGLIQYGCIEEPDDAGELFEIVIAEKCKVCDWRVDFKR